MKLSTLKPAGGIIILSFLFLLNFGTSNTISAQCEIGAIEATPTPCDSLGFFDLIINFEYANVGTMGFTVEGLGGIWGTFQYANLPVILYDLEGDGTTFYEFVIRDVEFPDCSNSVEIGIIDCDGGPCSIWNVDVFPQDCEEGYFYVHLGFWYENVGTEGFRVQGNGNDYGDFEFDDLPILIGPLEGDGVTEYEFVVIDNEYEDCSDWGAIDPVDCPGGECDIWDLVVDDHPCDSNGMFYVYVNFEYENVGNDGFALYINYDLYDNYSYDDLPLLEVGPLLGDGSTVYHFLVTDIANEDCAEDLNFGPIECGAGGDCNIWDVYADVMPCNEDGYFHVALDFEYVNVGNDGFNVHGNGVNYGNFNYDSIPVIIGPLLGDGTTEYEFGVVDIQYEECGDWTAIDPVDCGTGGDCSIWDVYADVMPCNEMGYFHVALDFEYVNVGNDGFNVHGNGVNYGNFNYDSIPVIIGPLLGDGTTEYEFGVVDIQLEECGDWTAIDPVDCGIGGNCEIGELETTILPCNANNEFYVLLDFDYSNTSDGFSVVGNGASWGNFLYANLPVEIGPLEANGTSVYEFLVQDNVYNDCEEDTYIDPVNCDSTTQLMNFTTQVVSCNNEMYELQLDFDVINGGDQGFMITGNGEDYGSYDYSQLPVTIGPLATDGSTPYHFIAKDKGNQDYGNWDRLIPFTCESLGLAEELVEAPLSVFPNPSSGTVNFETSNDNELWVSIYNSAGSELHSFPFIKTYTVNGLKSGIYYYKIIDKNGKHTSGKLIVTR